MKIKVSTVTKLTITEADGLNLDPISVFLEDYSLGQGKLTIECFGDAWSHYWGAMGKNDLRSFLCSAGIDYIAGKLFPCGMNRNVIDYDKISSEIGEQVDEHSLLLEEDAVVAAYGEDWQFNLPKKQSSQYGYLLQIVAAVKEAVGNQLAKAA